MLPSNGSINANAGSRKGAARKDKKQGPDGGVTKSQERIYSAQQLVQALKSAMASVRDQLQVLTILDSTASSWPGIQQCVDDLEFLIDMSGQTTSRLEKDQANKEESLHNAKDEVNTLRETLALQNEGKLDLQRQVEDLSKEVSQLSGKLNSADKEVAQQKQELWTLEKQRADLASEMERIKQDNEFMEGEINTLRATVTEQMTQVTALKEDLAARKADASHFKQVTTDQKGQIEHLKRSLDSANSQLRETSQQLNQSNNDRTQFEKEADRLQEECSRLTTELNKTSKELERLKEWGDVLKKVENDKLREEQDGRAKERLEAEAKWAALDKGLATAQSEVAHRDEKLLAKQQEATYLQKQLSLAGVQAKDLQKQISVLSTQKASAEKQAQQATAQSAKLQQQLQQAQIGAAQLDKAQAVAAGRTREAAAAERAKMQASMDEAMREGAVQKALAEGWARDLRDTQERLKKDKAKLDLLQSKMDEMIREGQDALVGGIKDSAGQAATIVSLQQAVTARESELKRMRAESTSEKKRLEQKILSLQRECNESAVEVQRLRDGLGNRLPLLNKPITMSDELENLKRMLQPMPASDRSPSKNGNQPLPRLAAGQGNKTAPTHSIGRAQLTR